GVGVGWFNLQGVSIDIAAFINNEYVGGASYTVAFGGNPFIQIDPDRPTGPNIDDTARRIAEGEAWDKYHAWVNCNTPIMAKYNAQLKQAHSDAFWRDVGAGFMTWGLLASTSWEPDTDIGTGAGPGANTMSGGLMLRSFAAAINTMR